MTARPLHAVLRALADTGPPDADADLLRRFVATRDDEAFASLVKRHGRLVWAVCRHLCRSDAEADDAFQATFLVLVRNAAGVKDAAKLSAWLHGVAYKVCGKSRLAAKRRTTREQATAARERNGHAIPDSAWDRALAAVHEEVSGLPDTLRVPFVLCCLEGKGQTEAAEQLGWKLGTLSGRLTRAKDAVLARLSARGLTLGVLASVGLAVVPADVSAKAVELGLVDSVIPGSVLQLSTGVIGMSVHKVKLLAAGVLAACGLAVSGGAGWVSSAGAQSAPPPTPAKVAAADRVKQLEAELQKARDEAEKAALDAEAARADAVKKAANAKAKADEAIAKFAGEKEKEKEKTAKAESATSTKRWEFEFVAVSEMPQAKFVKFLQDREDKGWEFVGTTPLSDSPVWVFRKPKGGTTVWAIPGGSGQYKYTTEPAKPPVVKEGTYYPVPPAPPAPPATPAAPLAPTTPKVPPTAATPAPTQNKSIDDAAEAIEAEIKRLQEKLEVLKKAKPKK
jgi:RNA polymerase sigma factor (sigma-70 family)